jgi:hypothetical protein
MGITWYRAAQGYVTNYSDDMHLIMFADVKTNIDGWNTSGWHVFGNADMRDCWFSNNCIIIAEHGLHLVCFS